MGWGALGADGAGNRSPPSALRPTMVGIVVMVVAAFVSRRGEQKNRIFQKNFLRGCERLSFCSQRTLRRDLRCAATKNRSRKSARMRVERRWGTEMDRASPATSSRGAGRWRFRLCNVARESPAVRCNNGDTANLPNFSRSGSTGRMDRGCGRAHQMRNETERSGFPNAARMPFWRPIAAANRSP